MQLFLEGCGRGLWVKFFALPIWLSANQFFCFPTLIHPSVFHSCASADHSWMELDVDRSNRIRQQKVEGVCGMGLLHWRAPCAHHVLDLCHAECLRHEFPDRACLPNVGRVFGAARPSACSSSGLAGSVDSMSMLAIPPRSVSYTHLTLPTKRIV